MIQQTLVVVEAGQQRADKVFLFEIAKACDDAIRGALLLNLFHAGALAGLIGNVLTLRNDAVETYTHVEPSAREGKVAGHRGKADQPSFLEISFRL